MTRGYPEEADIRITSDNQDPRSQSTSVDVLFLITDNVEGADAEEYEKLSSYLSENAITIDEQDRGLLAFRAELSFNREKDRYEKTHRVIIEQMMRRDTGYDSTDDIYGYLPHFMNSRSTNKTRCARAVAEAIANNVHGKPPIPPTIDRLFDELSSRLGW